MGNDFELLYYSYKKYIFEFLKVGYLPLWSPSEGLGYSLIFNPFAQYFYPLSWLLYGLGFLIGDLSKHTYLLYTIFALSIYNVGQYLWLKKLNIDIKYSLIATIITCCGLKLTEVLRFPNAVHTLAWFPWILYAMTLSLNVKNNYKSILIIFFSTLFVLTAGYPYYILYGLLLFSGYFIFINTSVFRLKTVSSSKDLQKRLKVLFINLIPALLAFFIVLPWFLGVQEIMEITSNRNLNNINFSSIFSSYFLDHIGSWIFPPISIAEGYYYFGSVVSLIMIVYLLNFFLKKNKNKFEFHYILFFFILYLFVYQFSNAENSYLFKIIWNNFDLIKNFRNFARINVILIPLFAVIIAFSLRYFSDQKDQRKKFITSAIVVLTIFFLQIYFIEIYDNNNTYWETYQKKRLDYASNNIEIFSFLFNSYSNYIYTFFLFLSFLILNFLNIKKKNNLTKFFVVILVLCELFVLANIQWAIPKNYYDKNGYNNLSEKPMENLKFAFKNYRVATVTYGNVYFRNNRNFNVNHFDTGGIFSHTKLFNKYFERNGEIKKNVSTKDKKSIETLWGINSSKDKVFFSKSIKHKTISNFIDDVKNNKINSKIKIDEEKYNGDEITIYVTTNTKGYITFLDNWAPRWKVFINNNEKLIEKTLGTYKSVKIDIGNHKIKFKYEPW